MSFKQQSCSHCFTTYEFYQGTRPAIVPNCPRCGAYANGWAPMTSEEFCRSMGCAVGRRLRERNE